MPLLFNYLKIPGCFISGNTNFANDSILNEKNSCESYK